MPGRADPPPRGETASPDIGRPGREDEAARWDWTYDPRNRAADAWIFRRSGEAAAELMAMADQPGGVWLDIGCGPGRITGTLAVPGRTVIGADIDGAMLQRAAETIRATAGPCGPRLIRADAVALPFADGSLDGLLATSFMGVAPSPREFLAEARRVLRPDGALVLTVSRRGSPLLRLNHWVSLARVTTGARRQYRLYTEQEVQRLLSDAGFRAVASIRYNIVLHLGGMLLPPRRLARSLDRLAGRFAPFLARNLAVLARRADRPGARDRDRST